MPVHLNRFQAYWVQQVYPFPILLIVQLRGWILHCVQAGEMPT